jgi:hypothetical protein
MPLINTLRRAHPSLSLENRTQLSGAVVGRAIYVALRAEPTTGAIDLRCGSTLRGVLDSTNFPGETRAPLPAAGIPVAVPALVAAEERQPAAWLDRTGASRSACNSAMLA